jgi:hypothetical protein
LLVTVWTRPELLFHVTVPPGLTVAGGNAITLLVMLTLAVVPGALSLTTTLPVMGE